MGWLVHLSVVCEVWHSLPSMTGMRTRAQERWRAAPTLKCVQLLVLSLVLPLALAPAPALAPALALDPILALASAQAHNRTIPHLPILLLLQAFRQIRPPGVRPHPLVCPLTLTSGNQSPVPAKRKPALPPLGLIVYTALVDTPTNPIITIINTINVIIIIIPTIPITASIRTAPTAHTPLYAPRIATALRLILYGIHLTLAQKLKST